MTRIAHLLGLALSAMVVGSCNQVASVPPPKQSLPNCMGGGLSADGHCWVSMVSLLGNPAAYDGLRVRTSGYVHFEFEGDALYLHKEDFDNLLPNSLWMSLRNGVPMERCQDSYALVEGRFRAGPAGHMGMSQGAVEDVTQCQNQGTRP
jgi:hypothetical protein